MGFDVLFYFLFVSMVHLKNGFKVKVVLAK